MTDRIVSFSGGATSAFMSFMIKEQSEREGFNCHFVFANTGQEDERTLEFVNRCDYEWGLNVVWLEAVTHHGKRKGCTHRVVDFETADRVGDVYEDVISKYGIPNKAYPHCTRELKQNPIFSWRRENNLNDAFMCVGIRSDEMDRMSTVAAKFNIIYPLVKNNITLDDVGDFWDSQPFKLELMPHEGNCVWCWKKSWRKLLTLAVDRPDVFAFPAKMEIKHGLSGHNVDGSPRVFFRENKTTLDLFADALEGNFTPITTEHKFETELDLSSACGESCEPFADEEFERNLK